MDVPYSLKATKPPPSLLLSMRVAQLSGSGLGLLIQQSMAALCTVGIVARTGSPWVVLQPAASVG